VWALAVLALVALVLLVRRDGGEDPSVEPSFNTTSTTTIVVTTTTSPLPACIPVANPSLLSTIAATAASAVIVDRGWFVAKPNGATWFTTADPTRDDEGELVPLNEQARTDSSSRRDVPYGDPLYQGHTDDEPAADAARSCASSA
jgi:hypothetical protein